MNNYYHKIIIIGVRLLHIKKSQFIDELNELEKLVETAGGKIIAKVEQTLKQPDNATFIGKGKVEELKKIIEDIGADAIVFDNDLKLNQIRNLKKELGDNIEVLGRSDIIYDIFALRARTNVAKIQVELARLEYILPRLTGMWSHLSRQFGGSIGNRGPGETQLEADKRVIRKRIAFLKERLKKIEVQRDVQSRARSSITRVAILGYTNSGKSTLLNKLTKADAYTEDKLFATLDPKTRLYRNSSGQTVLFTDTVGFIRKLPHHLVESFRSTLDEAIQADILLLVVDGSSESYPENLDVILHELNRMKISMKPKVLVFNKIDIADEFRIAELRFKYPESHIVSAISGNGLDLMINEIIEIANSLKINKI